VQIEACATRGHRIDLKVGQGRVRRVGEVLQWQADPRAPPGHRRAAKIEGLPRGARARLFVQPFKSWL
jgi:hypothetical protein